MHSIGILPGTSKEMTGVQSSQHFNLSYFYNINARLGKREEDYMLQFKKQTNRTFKEKSKILDPLFIQM